LPLPLPLCVAVAVVRACVEDSTHILSQQKTGLKRARKHASQSEGWNVVMLLLGRIYQSEGIRVRVATSKEL
jgi:hypothetical protein